MCITFSTLTESLTDGLTHVLTNWHVTLKMIRHRPPIVCHASTATSNLAALVLTNPMPMVLFFRQPLCPILGPFFLDADLALASSLTKKVILPLCLAPNRHEIRRENPWVDIVDNPLSTGNEATKTEESRLEYGPSFPLFLAKIYGWHCRIISEKFCDFSELYQFCCSTGVIPAWCVYTH